MNNVENVQFHINNGQIYLEVSGVMVPVRIGTGIIDDDIVSTKKMKKPKNLVKTANRDFGKVTKTIRLSKSTNEKPDSKRIRSTVVNSIKVGQVLATKADGITQQQNYNRQTSCVDKIQKNTGKRFVGSKYGPNGAVILKRVK
jgi:hypothetical protein